MKELNRILLIDDDRVTNLMHVRLIRRASLAKHVDVATDGVAALEYLNAQPDEPGAQPELILLDINMPRMDGFEFLQAYADLPQTLRDHQMIAMVSTSMLNADLDRAEADPHVKVFLNKPINNEDLTRLVAQWEAQAA